MNIDIFTKSGEQHFTNATYVTTKVKNDNGVPRYVMTIENNLEYTDVEIEDVMAFAITDHRCHWIKENGYYICPYCRDIVKGRDNTWKYCPKCGREVD